MKSAKQVHLDLMCSLAHKQQDTIKKLNDQLDKSNTSYNGVLVWKIKVRNLFNGFKVYIFWEGHKTLRNLHQLFDWQYIRIIGGDFAKFCDLLRIYKLYCFFKFRESRLLTMHRQYLGRMGSSCRNSFCLEHLIKYRVW